MEPSIRIVSHAALSVVDLVGLRTLFDSEYLTEFGEWKPDQPCGYAPHDVHVIIAHGDDLVGHTGWTRRRIRVGERDVVIAGVGGALVVNAARGSRLGQELKRAAVASMAPAGDIEFGYLGCREAVVPFYRSCGWTLVAAVERSLERV